MTTLSFPLRAQQMGLRDNGNECFQYDDSIGSVIYKHLQTKDTLNVSLEEDHTLFDIPLYGIFTKPPVAQTNFKYAGYVSDLYQFEGNEVMNQKIRQSILNVGTPIFREYIYLNPIRTRMSNEILIQHSTNIPNVGDVYPQVIVKNTYDGSGAREFLFGFSILEQNSNRLSGFGFEYKIGKIRQVHNTNSQTLLSSPIGQYVQFFSENIMEIIDENFRTEISEDDLYSVFGLLEDIGKKRKDVVSSFVSKSSENNNGKVSAWNLFLAITYFSTIEKNVNIKMLLNNIAEKVLIIPVKIQEVLNTLKVK